MIDLDINTNPIKSPTQVFIGGTNLNSRKHFELTIYCKEVFLQTIQTTKISSNFWMPINTPNFERNMDKADIDTFLSFNSLPNNLKELIS